VKGTDITQADKDQAKQFLEMVSGVPWPEDERIAPIQRSKLIALLAWYGRIRAAGGEAPGYLVSAKEERAARGAK